MSLWHLTAPDQKASLPAAQVVDSRTDFLCTYIVILYALASLPCALLLPGSFATGPQYVSMQNVSDMLCMNYRIAE